MFIVLVVSLGDRTRLGTVTYPAFDINNLGIYFDDYAVFRPYQRPVDLLAYLLAIGVAGYFKHDLMFALRLSLCLLDRPPAAEIPWGTHFPGYDPLLDQLSGSYLCLDAHIARFRPD